MEAFSRQLRSLNVIALLQYLGLVPSADNRSFDLGKQITRMLCGARPGCIFSVSSPLTLAEEDFLLPLKSASISRRSRVILRLAGTFLSCPGS